jgi:uncharacterized protein (DUF1499 family)
MTAFSCMALVASMDIAPITSSPNCIVSETLKDEIKGVRPYIIIRRFQNSILTMDAILPESNKAKAVIVSNLVLVNFFA